MEEAGAQGLGGKLAAPSAGELFGGTLRWAGKCKVHAGLSTMAAVGQRELVLPWDPLRGGGIGPCPKG